MHDALVGLLWFVPSIAILIAIGIIVFDEDKKFKNVNWSEGFNRVKKYRHYIFLLMIIVIGVKIENIIQDMLPIFPNFTYLFYNIEGNGIILFLQQYLKNHFLINMLSVFYLVSFSYIVVFTPFLFILRDDEETLKSITYAMVINYMILIPFYIFFNVSVTSHYPPDTLVKPLLYSNHQYRELILLMDRLTDNFPSGHISIPFSLFLSTYLLTKLKRYKIFLGLVVAFIAFSIVYLGIHWILDIIGGLLLGAFSYWAANNKKIRSFFDRFICFLKNHSNYK